MFPAACGLHLRNIRCFNAKMSSNIAFCLKNATEMVQSCNDSNSGEIKKLLLNAAKDNNPGAQYLLGRHLIFPPQKKVGAATDAAAVMAEVTVVKKAARKRRNNIEEKEFFLPDSLFEEHTLAGVLDVMKNYNISDSDLGILWLQLAASSTDHLDSLSLQYHHDAQCLLGNIMLRRTRPKDSVKGGNSDLIQERKNKTRKLEIAEAMKWYHLAAKAVPPHKDALFNLGQIYFDGISGSTAPSTEGADAETTEWLVEKNASLSYELFLKAADGGDISAQFWIGYSNMNSFSGLVETGSTSKSDVISFLQLALKYLHLAADGGHNSADLYLSTLYRIVCHSDLLEFSSEENLAKFRHHFRSAAVKFVDGEALYQLADMCRTGDGDEVMHILNDSMYVTSANTAVTTAASLWNKDVNEASGQDAVMEEHMKLAVELYRRAAEPEIGEGHVEAANCLGALFYHGYGYVPQRLKERSESVGDNTTWILSPNPEKSFYYYNLAGDKGNLNAWRNLAAMYMSGVGCEQSEETAVGIMRMVNQQEALEQ